jgi:hypothetical protein
MGKWEVPGWLKPFEPHLEETAGESLETLMAHYGSAAISVLVQRGRDCRALLANTQVALLTRLRAAGLLVEAPVHPLEAPVSDAERIRLAMERHVRDDKSAGTPLTVALECVLNGAVLTGKTEQELVAAFGAGVLAASETSAAIGVEGAYRVHATTAPDRL